MGIFIKLSQDSQTKKHLMNVEIVHLLIDIVSDYPLKLNDEYITQSDTPMYLYIPNNNATSYITKKYSIFQAVEIVCLLIFRKLNRL